jgi:hypothetical protein
MSLQSKYLGFYIGCKTNKGILTGTCKNSVFIQSEAEGSLVFEVESVGKNLFLCLRPLSDLTAEEVKMLIERGINIGRPKGYSFSPEAFIFLLSLYVDIFGLISLGYAKELHQ